MTDVVGCMGVLRSCSESATSLGNGVQLMPEFPLRLQFTAEIDISTSTTTATSVAVVEVHVHNVKSTQAEEAVGAFALSCPWHGVYADDVLQTCVYLLLCGLPELGPVYSSVQCSAGGSVKWIDRFPGRVVSVAGNAVFSAIGVDNGDLYIVSLSGRRLFPCIGACIVCMGRHLISVHNVTDFVCSDTAALGSALSLLECSPKQSPYLLVILTSGVLKVWHVSKRKLTLSESIEAITNVADPSDARRLTLLRCHITVKGQPILTFAKSHPESKGASSLISYTFDLCMGCW